MGYRFTVYLSNNQISGRLYSQYSISKYSKLTVITDAAKALEYISSFGTSGHGCAGASVGQETMKLTAAVPRSCSVPSWRRRFPVWGLPSGSGGATSRRTPPRGKRNAAGVSTSHFHDSDKRSSSDLIGVGF